jgi:hypothetical protein
MLKKSEIEVPRKSRFRAHGVACSDSCHSKGLREGRMRQDRSLRRAPKEISIQAASSLLNCDRGENSSFSTVSVETSGSLLSSGMRALGAGCAKTPARVHADLFCSLFRALRAFRSKKIAKNFALLRQPQKIAVFSHSLGGKHAYRVARGRTGIRAIAVVAFSARIASAG